MATGNIPSDNLSSSGAANPTMTSCRKKKNEEAAFLDDLRDHFDEFTHASMDEHEACFKNTINKMFGMSKVVAERSLEAVEVESSLPIRTALAE